MKLKKRKIITIIYAIFSIICISISIALFCLNPSLNPSIGITNSIIDIQPHYYVPIESTIKIPIRSHANLTEDDFQFHYDFTSEIKIWYDKNTSAVYIYSYTPTEPLSDTVVMIMSLKLNLICKTNIIFYENISFAINNLDLKLQQNENDVLTASCSDNDYVNTFNTGDPAFDTAHKDFGIYPSNVNYSVNAANLIMPNIMSLQQWYSTYQNQWVTFDAVKNFLNPITPLNITLQKETNGIIDPFVYHPFIYYPYLETRSINTCLPKGSCSKLNDEWVKFNLGPNNTKNFLFYKATSQMESDFELLSNNAKISFSNNLSEFNERINNFYPTMQNNFNFEWTKELVFPTPFDIVYGELMWSTEIRDYRIVSYEQQSCISEAPYPVITDNFSDFAYLKYLTTEGMEFNNQMFKNSINLIPDPSERTSITFNANTLPLKYNIEYSIIAHSVTRYTICARVNESIKILITTGNKISFSNIPKGLIFCKTYKTV